VDFTKIRFSELAFQETWRPIETNREKLPGVIISRGPMLIFVLSVEKNKLVRRPPLLLGLLCLQRARRRETLVTKLREGDKFKAPWKLRN